MKIPLLRLPGIVTGNEIFRVASLCLYITLLLHTVLAANVHDMMFSGRSMGAITVLSVLFFAALARYLWPAAIVYGRSRLLTELSAAMFVVIGLMLQYATPALPLLWLIGLAGVFPLALERTLALAATLAMTLIGVALNITLGTQLVDWLPYMFAALFVGLSAIFLADALNSNLAAVRQAQLNQRRFEEEHARLQHQALHDPLTGLPNRRHLLKTIADTIAQTHEPPRQLAMLFCDLDFFKSVNDTHGHDFGDKCLQEITRRILAELPTQDFVARFGGNEFVILSHATLEQAKAKADALLQAVSRQLMVDDALVKIQTSIGIALLDPEHKNASELIRDADAAMYQAKERGRNRAEIFDASLQSDRTKRAQMDVALRFALERDELMLVYQPKVSILNGAVKGFELLLRWNNPQYGMIPPMEFIPVAESSGLVVPIGQWVLEQACRQLSAWRRDHPDMNNFTVAVNVSMRQLLQSSFLDEVAGILERTGVDASSIELELTETSAMANPVQTIETLSKLKTLGFRLALDDFGTGYSSLAHLQKLPIDVLKIDKAFVQGLDQNPGDVEIVRLILALAQTLNLDTVAEGVETRDDMLKLKKMGCYLAQGFAFSPPVPADEAGEMLRTSQNFQVA